AGDDHGPDTVRTGMLGNGTGEDVVIAAAVILDRRGMKDLLISRILRATVEQEDPSRPRVGGVGVKSALGQGNAVDLDTANLLGGQAEAFGPSGLGGGIAHQIASPASARSVLPVMT